LPTYTVGYEGRCSRREAKWSSPNPRGKRLMEAGVLEEATKSKRRTKK
jgi:hypothetical protein